MSLVLPVREYINALVHSSVRGDSLQAARHRAFIAPRVLGGLIVFGLLPIYLVARGTLGLLEAVVFGWFAVAIALAYYLSRTGRYETAHVMSSLALTGVVTLSALMSGGLGSPVAVWLVLVPLEAALCASRRVVAAASALAFGAAALLFSQSLFGFGPVAAGDGAASHAMMGLSLGAATFYAAMLALSADSLTRTGSRLLNEEEERYRLLAVNMTDCISRHGSGGRTQFISPAAERLFGVPACELLGHGLFDRIHVTDRPAYLTALAAAAAGGDTHAAEFRVRGASGGNGRDSVRFIWMEMRCRAVASAPFAGGEACEGEVVAVMRDVSSRKEQEQAVADARSESEKANAAKSYFLATMSHELRTPLNAVIGFSEMLMHEDTMQIDAARRQDYARLIRDSGQHLLSVVNLVLDMSKIESGNFVITPEPFAPAAVIRSCCDLLALKAHEGGLDIVMRIPADLPEMTADKRALKQMLFNLLSNAIKFTNRGGRVTVTAAIETAQLAISIEDTGVGIREADLPRLGDPFFQARGTYDRPHEGTGLGLSIVKGLVGLHDGRMEVHSRVGVGTRITLRLPLDCEARHAGGSTVIELGANVRRESASEVSAPGVRPAVEAKKSA